ncbi:hypothetical protein [Natrinema sp. 1APR25-10V2]|uniref:DUF7344 domain-containing protein n=1 Tax=Natrinema sp. 1APR25-10V2 TaxID=2951081 RepID=UPI00287499E0|nr:hypothetical protein [Natrinema sp. 1APR25-10V2]MDS0478038.1 hypothetical protein [Natrinema sp. 1APR25-10V2]
MDTGDDPSDLDAIYGLLSDPYRRYVLYYFLENERATIDRLALQLAAWEHDKAVESVSEDEKETITVALRHNHLPQLEDHGIVTVNQRSGDIVAETGFDGIRATAERAREVEGPDSIVGNATESFLYSDPVAETTSDDR